MNYVLQRWINPGTIGIVKDPETDTEFCFKRNRPKRMLHDPTQTITDDVIEASIKLLENEYRCQQQAEGPHVPKVQGFFRHGKSASLLMYSIGKETLHSRLSSLDASSLFHVLLQTAQALQQVHQAGVYHHDIKSENIFLPQNKPVQIADFEFAKLVGKDYHADDMEFIYDFCTPELAAPEQLIGMPNSETDAWLLAQTIYECIAAKLHPGQQHPINHELPQSEHTPRWSTHALDIFSTLCTFPRELAPLERILGKTLVLHGAVKRPAIDEFVDVLAYLAKRYSSRTDF